MYINAPSHFAPSLLAIHRWCQVSDVLVVTCSQGGRIRLAVSCRICCISSDQSGVIVDRVWSLWETTTVSWRKCTSPLGT